MKSYPLVSIVLPTYNGARFIADAIQSCMNQTYRNWELIVVDDASADDTLDIVDRIAKRDYRIRCIRHERNRRLPAALNTGFVASRGNYLTWTSDDNLYERDAITTMVDALDAQPQVGLVYCDVRRIDENGNDLGVWNMGDPTELRSRNCVGACFLYRRDVYEEIGEYSADMFLVEDYDYWLRVAARFSLSRLAGHAPYRYRCHSGSLTATRCREVALQHARALARHSLDRRDARRVLGAAHWEAHWHAVSTRELRTALSHAICAVAYCPLRMQYWKTAVGALLRLRGERGALRNL